MQDPNEVLSALLKTLQVNQESIFFKEALELYIPPQVGKFAGDNAPQDAGETIASWLKDENSHCLLLMGDSGAGKTLLGQWLTREVFKETLSERIPLFIPLLAYKDATQDLINKHLKKMCGIKEESQRALIKELPLLLILDGYDEMHTKINLYRSNQLWQFKNLKVIISCRSQWLATVDDYRALFYSCNADEIPLPQCLQELVITPFTPNQIKAYLQKYVASHQEEIRQSTPSFLTESQWTDWQTYQTHIEKLPGLQSLLSSPFVLSLLVQVLPDIVAQHQNEEKDKIDKIEQLRLVRITLYDHFVGRWFVRQKQKLLRAGHISDNCPIEDTFKQYSKALAHAMLQAGVSSFKYNPKTVAFLLKNQGLFSTELEAKTDRQDEVWAPCFMDETEVVGQEKVKLSLIFSGCPLIQLGENTYAFLHKSLLEYFAARKLFEGAMMSASIALGIELNAKLLTQEPDTLIFLAEQVEKDEHLKQRLFDVIEESKYEERVQIAAANAITILSYAGVSFTAKAWRHIRVPGADLSHALLDSADLREADLREVTLNSAWLNHAKLGGALMQGVKFSEWPYLETENPTRCIAYSPDGGYMAAGSGNAIILYQQKEKAYHKVGKLKGHTGDVESVAFHPNGHLLASGSQDNTVWLWDIQSQKQVAQLEGHTGRIESVAFHPKGHLLASGSYDHTVRLWDIQSQKQVAQLEGHTGGVMSVTFHPNGHLLASGSYDKTVRLWDIQSQKQVAQLEGHVSDVSSLAFHPKRHLLASGSYDNTVRLWDIQSQKQVAKLKGHTRYVWSVAFHPNGHFLASGGKDNTVRLWDIQSQKQVAQLEGHTSSVESVAFHPNGHLLASGSEDNTVRLWDIQSQKQVAQLEGHTSSVESVAFHPNGHLLASGSEDNTVRLWDIQNQQQVAQLEGHTFPVTSVAFHPNGHLLASGSWDNTVRLWDIQSQKQVTKLKGHTSFVESVTFHPNGHLLASGSLDNTVRLWDIQSQKQVAQLEGHTDDVTSVAFHPNGHLLASGSWDNTVRLWDIQSQKQVAQLEGHVSDVWSVAFHPKGYLLASGSSDKTVRLWDIQSQKQVAQLEGHTDDVKSVAFHPKGHLLASGSYDNTVRLWDIQTKQCAGVFTFTHSIKALSFCQVQEKTWLCAGVGTELYYFEVKDLKSQAILILMWSTGRRALKSDSLDLGGVIGLEERNEDLLKQRHALGKLSQKETENVLKERNALTPFNPKHPPRNLFGTNFITPQTAVVSLTRKKKDKGSEHVFLVIETIEDDYYMITRADLFLDTRQKYSQGIIITSGQALVEIHTKPLADMQLLAEQCVYKCWPILAAKAKELLDNLEADRLKRLAYFNLGNSPLYNLSQEKTHSCVTWCEDHLSKIGIDVSNQQSWVDALVAHPKQHLPATSNLQNPDEEEPNSTCLLM